MHRSRPSSPTSWFRVDCCKYKTYVFLNLSCFIRLRTRQPSPSTSNSTTLKNHPTSSRDTLSSANRLDLLQLGLMCITLLTSQSKMLNSERSALKKFKLLNTLICCTRSKLLITQILTNTFLLSMSQRLGKSTLNLLLTTRIARLQSLLRNREPPSNSHE